MINSKFREKPKEVLFEVTSHCNCRCVFCHNQNSFARSGRDAEDLSTEQVKTLIERVANAGIERIRFTGGEPMLRNDLFELATYAKQKGLRTVLNTNGLLVNLTNASRIVDLFDICLVSLFSLDEHYVQSVTGVSGSLQKKLASLELLRGCRQLWVSTLIGDNSLPEQLLEMHDIMTEHNVHNWFLLRTNGTTQNSQPNRFEQIERIVDAILFLEQKTGRLLNIGNPIPFCCYLPYEMARIVNDGVWFAEARSKMTVNPFGKIVVDYCIDTIVGDVFTNDLLEIWRGSALEKIRSEELLPQECRKCALLSKCNSGSRFASRLVTGSLGNLDPLARPQKYPELFC